MSVKVENFGCRLNALEGDVAKAAAKTAGLDKTIIINGCAVTGEALRQARQAARRAKRAGPDHEIIVTGCAAQTDAPTFAAMPEVDRVLGNEEKLDPAAYAAGTPVAVSDIMARTRATPLPATPQPSRARAFVQVQTGCDHRCTFCIIPFGRGNARSVPIAEVVAQCRDLVARGHNEIVLTGVDVTSYGPDIGEIGLGGLVRAILDEVPELARLRLSSIDAVEIDPTLLDMVIHEERLMPHLHLSLQAGDNMILKRMKRRHTREQAVDFCEKLKAQRPEIVFGADIIAGFPTETDPMFENSLALVADCDIAWLHVFPFSPRPGTPAARMPQLAGDIIKERAAALREAGARQRTKTLEARIGTRQSVLVEKSGEGRTPCFARVEFEATGDAAQSGDIIPVRITAHDGERLLGEIDEGRSA
ncbi:MAG: tRNA (N(6)-L-threonylcarbamoyladenosine(37)-C(2))-methylthiotransferase MtaB [Parvibaculales bacterium]